MSEANVAEGIYVLCGCRIVFVASYCGVYIKPH